MRVMIDRFEEKFAVVELENGTMINMPKELIPAGSKEGDVIGIEVDANATKARREKIKKIMDQLWED